MRTDRINHERPVHDAFGHGRYHGIDIIQPPVEHIQAFLNTLNIFTGLAVSRRWLMIRQDNVLHEGRFPNYRYGLGLCQSQPAES